MIVSYAADIPETKDLLGAERGIKQLYLAIFVKYQKESFMNTHYLQRDDHQRHPFFKQNLFWIYKPD